MGKETRDYSTGDTVGFLRQSSLRSRRNIVVTRPIFSQDRFDSCHELGEYGTPTSPWGKLKRACQHKLHAIREWHPNFSRLALSFLVATFPILGWIPKYQVRNWLLKDVIAGITVGVMNIPQGMAYGLLAAMPAVFGLYTSFFPVLIYTIMCTSRHVSVGVFAIVSIMTSKIVNQYVLSQRPLGNLTGLLQAAVTHDVANVSAEAASSQDVSDNLEFRITALVVLTVAVGIWQVLMGILGLGYLTVYLSDQLVKGFTTGSAFHVFTSQLRPIFGLSKLKQHNGAFNLIYTYADFFKLIPTTHIPTLIISIVCTVFLVLVKYLLNNNAKLQARLPIKIPLPGELLVVIFGATISYLMKLGPSYGVDIVGEIPLGMPVPRVPDFSILPSFAVDSFTVAVVSFAITLSLAKLYGSKYHYVVESNQELRALGFSNIFGGFFQCIPATASLGRTAVQTSIGGETQIVSVISAVFIFVVLLALGYLLEPLPKACLGCIIIVALTGMLSQIVEVKKLWKISAVDTSVFVVTLIAVVILDVDLGLGVAVGWSLLTVVFRTQRPDVSVLGRALHTDIYKRLDVYKSTAEVPGCKIIRFDAPLYFANADYFMQKIREIAYKKTTIGFKNSFSNRGSSIGSAEHGNVNRGVQMNDVERQPSAEIVYTPSTKEDGPSTVDASTWTSADLDSARQPVNYIIVDCSSMCFVDVNGINAILHIAKEFSEMGLGLYLSCCKANMREFLSLCGFTPELPIDHLFITIHDAVMCAIRIQNSSDAPGQQADSSLDDDPDSDVVFENGPPFASFATQTVTDFPPPERSPC